MALSAAFVCAGRRCLQPRNLFQGTSAIRCLSTSSVLTSPSGRHFRTDIEHHPLYKDLPKPEHQQKPKEESKLAAGEEYDDYVMPHVIWGKDEAEDVSITHHKPQDKTEKAAYYTVQSLRFTFDLFSGYLFGSMNEITWLRRIIFLETVAGVPGFMGAMVRHLQSLRCFRRDHGWIHTLLEEAENERMHLLTALELRKPSWPYRWAVLFTQGVFTNMFFLAYLVSPRFCHRFVGYLEEEAVKTYTHCLADLDKGNLKMWEKMAAPPIAISYWRLGEDAMMRDVILAIRADEAHHRLVNHTLGGMKPDQKNPFGPGQ